jgi:carnosine N-methyltransferase
MKYFPNTKNENNELISVLIPGAGLGRLLYEFAKAGYKAQGNDFSYFLLLASNFILNCSSQAEEFEIKPLIHSFSNVFWNNGPFKEIKVPDEALNIDSGEMSMVAGEFVEVYKKQVESWDSVVTCFFIDTAHNIIEYVETIYQILKKGGVWINLGPLLYHYTDMEKEVSIELSWEELKHIIINMGFEIKNESIRESYYSSDIDSMLKSIYKCIFFTAVKI